jgi:hypothetical protein
MGALLPQWQAAHADADEQKTPDLEHIIVRQPFADVVQAMLRYAHAPGAADLFADRIHLLPILRNPVLRARLLG